MRELLADDQWQTGHGILQNAKAANGN